MQLEQSQKAASELLEQNRALQDQLKVALGREQSAREGYVLQVGEQGQCPTWLPSLEFNLWDFSPGCLWGRTWVGDTVCKTFSPPRRRGERKAFCITLFSAGTEQAPLFSTALSSLVAWEF